MANRNNRKKKQKEVKPNTYVKELISNASETSTAVNEIADVERITGVAIKKTMLLDGAFHTFVYSIHYSWGHSRLEEEIFKDLSDDNPEYEESVADKVEVLTEVGSDTNLSIFGFQTNKRVFITRQEAVAVAINAKQTSTHHTVENLYSLNSYHIQRS